MYDYELPDRALKDLLAQLHRQRANVAKFGPEFELPDLDRRIRTLQAELNRRLDAAESGEPGS